MRSRGTSQVWCITTGEETAIHSGDGEAEDPPVRNTDCICHRQAMTDRRETQWRYAFSVQPHHFMADGALTEAVAWIT